MELEDQKEMKNSESKNYKKRVCEGMGRKGKNEDVGETHDRRRNCKIEVI